MNERLNLSATDSKKGNLSEPRLFLHSVTAVSKLLMNQVSHLPVGAAQQFFWKEINLFLRKSVELSHAVPSPHGEQ